ncbi:LVIVD repeat-containing protein [Kribbella sp. NPDC049174]|uniref:LVIVD repeat-containing protein n=1 Tax=Kribbella sp. NPDC049174 TaxID=3364112 RepID=UPI003714359C
MRRPRTLVRLALTVALLTGLAGTASADPPDTGASKSDNITHLASVPMTGALTGGLNTDIAFAGKKAYVGNFAGFAIYDVGDPANPRMISQVACPGSQNDISVYGGLLFLSTDQSRSNNSCQSVPQSPTIKESWEGIKIFDVRDPANPRYVAAVETKCGSHTHTLIPEPSNRSVYIYNSSFFPNATYPDCQPPNDRIDIIKVPLRDPAKAAVVASPVLFPDGGFPGSETGDATSGCHDITAFPARRIAAAACMGDGVLLDISRPAAPRVIDRVQDAENFSFWHGATFNGDGTKVVFMDELGGGGGAECNEAVGPDKGATAVFDILHRKLKFRSYYKIPRHQAEGENCVSHNGSLIPVRGRDIMVQAWYQGGFSVWDFTDSANPHEIGYFDRPPRRPASFGGYWSAYYYNGTIYGTESVTAFDTFKISDARTDSAGRVKLSELNVQTQPAFWG